MNYNNDSLCSDGTFEAIDKWIKSLPNPMRSPSKELHELSLWRRNECSVLSAAGTDRLRPPEKDIIRLVCQNCAPITGNYCYLLAQMEAGIA